MTLDLRNVDVQRIAWEAELAAKQAFEETEREMALADAAIERRIDAMSLEERRAALNQIRAAM